VVVDNGSTDATVAAIRSTHARLMTHPHRSPYRARNLAIEQTESEFVAMTDARCLAEPNWLFEMIRKAEETDAMLVGGLTVFELTKDSLGNRLFVETHQPDQMRAAIEQYSCVAGNNMLIRREAFERYGLFKTIRSGSDIEFSKRLAQNGHAPVFAESAIVKRQCDLSNWAYLKRCYRIRFGQRMHSTKPTGIFAACSFARCLPWRPGFRAGGSAAKECGSIREYFTQWIYRWATRWAAFFGEWHAALVAKKAVNER
ncbi:MAG: glycosyltransferase, partial [Planctomycetota bacterium]